VTIAKQKRRPGIASLVLLTMCVLPGLATAQSSSTVSHDYRQGVVKILVEKTNQSRDTGAGVVVGFDENLALILTAAHVIDSAAKIEVVFYDKLYYNYAASAFSRRNDDLDIGLVVLDLDQGPAVIDTLPSFKVGDSTNLREGSLVAAIGHPLGSDWQVSKNSIVGLSHQDDFRKLMFTNTRVDRGNSGGPLLNEGGSLIGMVLEKAPLQAVAVKIDAVLAVLRAWRIPLNFLDLGGGAQVAAPPAAPPGQSPDLAPEPAPELAPDQPTVDAEQPVDITSAVELPTPPASTPVESGEPTVGESVAPPSPPVPGAEATAGTEPATEPAVIFRPGADNPFNHVPVAVADGAVTAEDAPLVIHVLANDSDQDGDLLTVSAFARESDEGGTVATDGTIVTYIPPQDFHGSDTFEYGISDGNEGTATASVTIAVTPVNDAPVLETQKLKVNEGESLEAKVAATDPDGDELTFSAEGLPEGASIDAATGVIRFTPSYSFSEAGKETVLRVDLVASDGKGGESRQTSDLKVADVPGGLDPGEGVEVTLAGAHPVSLGFERVTASGVAKIGWAPAGEGFVRPGYRLSGNGFIDLASTAQFSGNVRVCVDHSSMTLDQSALTLQRWIPEGGSIGGGQACGMEEGCWVELAAGAAGGQLCGSTDGLSRVGLMERLEMELSSDVVRKGAGVGATVRLADAGSLTGAAWSWGDGESAPAEVGTDGLTGAHKYSLPGFFEVELLLDSAAGRVGSARRMVVVYDPEAGSMSGKGTFGSPAGAGKSGPAEFNVSARYRSGSTTPTGKVTFEVGDLKFKADSLDWLAVAKGLVGLQASGKINNSGAYKLLFSVQTSASGDKVRVRVQDGEGAVVYDSQPGQPDNSTPTAALTSGRLKVTR
jgi:hypothetical protein